MKIRNLLHSYAGMFKQLYSTKGEITGNIVEIPLLDEDDEHMHEDRITITIARCDCCNQEIQIILDGDDNMIGVRCPHCRPLPPAS